MNQKNNTLLLFLFFPCLSCSFSSSELSFDGKAYGTHYRVTFVQNKKKPLEISSLQRDVKKLLTLHDSQLSIRNPKSRLAQFNAWDSGKPFPISRELARVFQYAKTMVEKSQGAFDPAVKSLNSSSPDGGRNIVRSVPSHKSMLDLIGGGRGFWVKRTPGVQLDFNGVAKGFTVDEMGRWLQSRQCQNFLIEFGGEVLAVGKNASGEKWRVGVETPGPRMPKEKEFLSVLSLTNAAVATSGIYREPHHIINPQTGMPIKSHVLCASVVAPTCMEADAAATALMVMGMERGLAWIEKETGWEAFFSYKDSSGELKTRASSGWKNLLGKKRFRVFARRRSLWRPTTKQSHFLSKFEIRTRPPLAGKKSEGINKSECFNFKNSTFGFPSNFGFRYSDLSLVRLLRRFAPRNDTRKILARQNFLKRNHI